MSRKLDEDRAFELMQDGAEAYHDRRDINSHPWPQFSPEREAFRDGWLNAQNKDYYLC